MALQSSKVRKNRGSLTVELIWIPEKRCKKKFHLPGGGAGPSNFCNSMRFPVLTSEITATNKKECVIFYCHKHPNDRE